MKIVVGIGNPGIKYINNRHNIGHMVIDKLSTMVNGQRLMVKKTNSYMNNSGEDILKLLNHQPLDISHLYVVHDDLDIPLGSFKIQFGKGPKEHKGLVSIYEALGTRDFWHVRIGIDDRQQALGTRIKGEDYVLQDFTNEERIILEKVIKQICNQLIQ